MTARDNLGPEPSSNGAATATATKPRAARKAAEPKSEAVTAAYAVLSGNGGQTFLVTAPKLRKGQVIEAKSNAGKVTPVIVGDVFTFDGMAFATYSKTA